MAATNDLAIPKGATVLVTGANGYIGSHVADQYLLRGYKVRGTVRDQNKNAWLAEFFHHRYGRDSFELVSVSDLAVDGAFDEAVKGVSAIAHTASVVNFDPNPNNVIPVSIAGALNALKSAYSEPTVKRFVLTSSSTAAVSPRPGRPESIVAEGTWNEEAVTAAWAEPPYNPERSLAVYAASKTQAEQAVWNFHREHQKDRPDLVVNTVLPDVAIGNILDAKSQGSPSSSALVVSLWNGEISPVHHMFPPQYYVNVQDVGRLHVAATILPTARDQRIFGFAGRFNWDMVLDILHKRDPDRKLPDHFAGGQDSTEVPTRGEAERLLRDIGQHGWVSLEDCVADNLSHL